MVHSVLEAAEKSVELSRSTALEITKPFVNPLVEKIGGWEVIDNWACENLDKLETSVPVIKKPTDEVRTIKIFKIIIFGIFDLCKLLIR